MKTKKIEVDNGRVLEFPIIDFKGKVGDEVWWNSGTEESPYYCRGVIKELQPDYWWVYVFYDENRHTREVPCLGHATVRFEDEKSDTILPYSELLLKNPGSEVEKVTVPEDFAYQEALQSIIMVLDTPIARRKQDEYLNKCVAIVKKKMIEDGMWSHCW